MDLFSGETAIFSYAVQLTRSTLSDAYGVTGTITANNTNTTLPALVDVVDCLQVSVAGVWTNVPGVPCIPVATTLPPGVSTLPYTFANVPLDQANTYRNQVTIDGLISATAPVTFPSVPSGETNGTVHVTDTNGLSWTVSTSATETYTKTVSCPADHSGYGGHEVANTATITETGQASSAEAYYSCNGLTVTKTAATAQTRTWNWTVAKAVTPTSATVAPGQSLLLDYAIVYDATAALSDFAVTGTIHIANSNTARAATLVEVADALAGGIAATVSCPATSVPAGGALDCTYAALVPDGSTRVNTATVLQQLYTFDADGVASPNGTDAFTATATASFSGASTTVVDACTAISDTYGDSGLPTSICVDGGVPRRFAYSRSILFDPGVCGPQQVVNTAAFNTNERHVVGRSTATSTITVQCQTGCTLTQGYWKTHSLAGPAPYDDNWASVGGSSSMFAFGLSYLTVFTTPPAGGNAWYQLAHQYIAAVLNVNNGASTPPTVSAAIASANSLFANPLYTPAYIGALKANNALRMQYNNLAGILGSYNEGSVGPGHCTEDRRSAP
jgi:hypothetical protein